MISAESYLKKSRSFGFTDAESIDNLMDEIRKRDRVIRNMAMLLKRAMRSKCFPSKLGLQIWAYLCENHLVSHADILRREQVEAEQPISQDKES